MLKDLWITLRELLYALVGQPTHSGATREEAQNNRAQQEHLKDAPPATAREAAAQIVKEAGKAAILQPSARAKSKR